jgi:hypothetical protein
MRVEQPLRQRFAPSRSLRNQEAPPLVTIVDDDAAVREALSELIQSGGF